MLHRMQKNSNDDDDNKKNKNNKSHHIRLTLSGHWLPHTTHNY